MNTNDGRLYENERLALEAGVPRNRLMMINPTTKQLKAMKVGRNDPCPCGSGLKFKKCHLGKDVP